MKSLFLLLFFSVNAFSITEEDFMKKANTLKTLVTAFEKMCVSPSGKVLLDTVVTDKKTLTGDGRVIVCRDEARRLDLLAKEVEADLKTLEKQDAECRAQGVSVLNKNVKNNVKDIKKVVDAKVDEPNQCLPQSRKQCAKDMACSVVRDLMHQPLFMAQLVGIKPKRDSCVVGKSTCAVEFINGVIKDIFSNAEAIWDLAKMTGRGIKNAAVKGWDFLFGVEDKASDAAHAASKLKPGMFEMFKKDPWGFIKELSVSIWEDMNKAIKENFACGKWSGAPHFSKCLAPLSTWDCATCDQRINAVCGVGGILGGEVLIAYLTGGAANVLGKVGGKGAQLFSKAGAYVLRIAPKVSKVPIVAKTVARITVVAEKTLATGRKVISHKTVQAVRQAGLKTAQGVKKGAKAVVSTAPVKITLKVMKGAASPVTAYVGLLDDAFRVGMKHSDQALKFGKTKLSHILSANKAAQGLDEVVVHLNQVEAISHDVLKARLKKEGVPFEEIVMKDGTPAIRVKQAPECGSKSYLFK